MTSHRLGSYESIGFGIYKSLRQYLIESVDQSSVINPFDISDFRRQFYILENSIDFEFHRKQI